MLDSLTASDEWRVESGEWRVESGEWLGLTPTPTPHSHLLTLEAA